MIDARTDAVAQRAARLLARGRAADPAEAIRAAAQVHGLHGARPPSIALVRRHLHAMVEEALGAEAFARLHAERLEIAGEILGLVDVVTGGDPALLAGRAAAGIADPDEDLSLRVYTRTPGRVLADALRDHGYADPALASRRAAAGWIDELRFEEAGLSVVLRVCPPALLGSADRDLFTGRSIRVAWWR